MIVMWLFNYYAHTRKNSVATLNRIQLFPCAVMKLSAPVEVLGLSYLSCYFLVKCRKWRIGRLLRVCRNINYLVYTCCYNMINISNSGSKTSRLSMYFSYNLAIDQCSQFASSPNRLYMRLCSAKQIYCQFSAFLCRYSYINNGPCLKQVNVNVFKVYFLSSTAINYSCCYLLYFILI